QASAPRPTLVREAVLGGYPTFLHRLVLERQHAHDALALDLDDEVAAERVVRRHGLAPRQLPRARGISERLAGQRADRAYVDRVAGQLGVDRLADESDDFRVLAA